MKRLLICIALLLIGSIASAASISFKWDPNTEADLAGYVLYASRTPDMSAPVKMLETTATTATIDSLAAGRPYYFAVVAKNTAGVQSSYSNTVFFSQPVAPTALQMVVNQLIVQ